MFKILSFPLAAFCLAAFPLAANAAGPMHQAETRMM